MIGLGKWGKILGLLELMQAWDTWGKGEGDSLVVGVRDWGEDRRGEYQVEKDGF